MTQCGQLGHMLVKRANFSLDVSELCPPVNEFGGLWKPVLAQIVASASVGRHYVEDSVVWVARDVDVDGRHQILIVSSY